MSRPRVSNIYTEMGKAREMYTVDPGRRLSAGSLGGSSCLRCSFFHALLE